MVTGDYDWISRRAHEIWQNEGCPEGRDREHWLRAVSEAEILPDSGRQEQTTAKNFITSVLVVDDEPLIRFAAVDALEDAGFDVLEAGSADEALAIFQRRRVDAVFTDINMPGVLDGLELASRVRKLESNTRVIVTSGHLRLGRHDLASGISFLPKPYDLTMLVRMLAASQLEH